MFFAVDDGSQQIRKHNKFLFLEMLLKVKTPQLND